MNGRSALFVMHLPKIMSIILGLNFCGKIATLQQARAFFNLDKDL